MADPLATPRFDGSDYVPELDDERLTGQLARVHALMRDGAWRTLAEIEAATGDPPASISAQLRHLRKDRFGAWVVEKRPRGDRRAGLFEYRLLPPVAANDPAPAAASEPAVAPLGPAELARALANMRAHVARMRAELATLTRAVRATTETTEAPRG